EVPVRVPSSELRAASRVGAGDAGAFDARPSARPVATPAPSADAVVPVDLTGEESLATEALSRPPGAIAGFDGAPTERTPDQADATTVELTAKKRIARYQTQALVHRSASALLFRARDPNVSRELALKVLDPDLVADRRIRREEWVSLFKKEARIAGRFYHPRVPALFDAGRDGNVYFLAYALVEGESLQQAIDRAERFDPERVRRIVADVASALDHLHTRGVVHCDVRAANVVLGKDGHAYLVDFSMATEADGPQHPLLASNLPVLAPEYLAGFGYTARSDQFALGALVYQLLTGVRPFRGASDGQLLQAIESESPRPPEALDSRVDAELSKVTMRLLEKDPALRFDGLDALVRLLDGARAVRPPEREPLPERSKTPIFARGADRDPEGDTQPSLRPITSPRTRHSKEVDIVIIDPELDPEVAGQVYTGHGERVAVYPDLEQEFEQIARDVPQTVVVSRTGSTDLRALRRRIAEVSRNIELRIVPELAGRLVGPVLGTEELAAALAETYQRTTMLSQPIDPGADTGAVGAARAIALRLGAGPSAELLAPLAVAARDLAARLRLSPTSEGFASLVPKDVEMIFGEVERVLTEPAGDGAPTASLVAQIVAVVEQYFALTWPRDGRRRVSPRRAILELREATKGHVKPEVVDALTEHLRAVISALDLGPAEPASAKILVAGTGRGAELAAQLSSAGFAIERADNGHVAWEKLRREPYAGAIVELALGGRDGLSLLKLCRAHPDTDQMPFLVLTPAVEPELARDVASAGAAALVEESHKLEAIRAHVGRWLEARHS
ncbi:protein kinase, partial [Myxococcota bacterium]|nr:protein kinase [Myxococcota bacterium]